MIYYVLVFAAVVAAWILQEFIPAAHWAYDARLLLLHSVYFCAAITVPFPVMLGLAFVAGFLWDARYHVNLGEGTGELAFGLTVLLFGFAGAFLQGIRPLFRRGRWELPVLMVGLASFGVLMVEFLVISFQRGGLAFFSGLWLKVLVTSLFSMLAAPALLYFFSALARRVGYRIRMEGIARKYFLGESVQN